jgi:hypothetical protein
LTKTDLRYLTVKSTLENNHFINTGNQMRTALSSSGNLAAVGSRSGHMVIFNANKPKTEKVLRDEIDGKPIVNCAW